MGGRFDTAHGFSDPLAAALATARATAVALDASAWSDLTPERASAVVGELYDTLGAQRVGAKIGAIDKPVQEALGTNHPFVAPLFADVVVPSGVVVARSSLIAPSIELEIGLVAGDDGAVPIACVEIVDSRWGWGVGIDYANADFGCQGLMLFGEPVADAPRHVEAVARLDGMEVARGEGPVADAEARLALVAETVAGVADASVATGSLIVPIPLTAGEWEFDFGPLGALALTVRP